MLAGFSGMTAATRGNSRTAQAASESGQAKALNVSYFSGSVMGLAVAGLGLLGLGFWFWYYGGDPETAKYINGFAMGASSIALFARVGGGVYTKAADVGADLVGKVEAGIPEDDPRNPGVIADNVGDNVGDIAGMGADIFESFVGSVIATIAIAATLTITPEFLASFPVLKGLDPTVIKLKYMSMPILCHGRHAQLVHRGVLHQDISERKPCRGLEVHHLCGCHHFCNPYRNRHQFTRHALGRFLGRVFRSPLRNCNRSSC
jgi:K(+)-stimulated pyrophosphate-energized sodium pump